MEDGPPPPPEVPPEDILECINSKKWNFRVAGYEKAIEALESGEKSAADILPLCKKACLDSHAAAQEQGVKLASASFKHASVDEASRFAGEVGKAICDKCLGGRPGTKNAAAECVLEIVAAEQAETLLPQLVTAFKARQPKVVLGAVSAVRGALQAFGPKIVSAKAVLKAMMPLFEHSDKNVRSETLGMAVDFYCFLGEAVKSHFEELRSAQVKELEEQFSSATVGSLRPKRFIRSAKPEPADTAAPSASESQTSIPDASQNAASSTNGASECEIDPLDLVDEVDILKQLSKGWPDAVLKAAKWQERKELLDELCTLASTPKITPGDFGDIMRSLKRLTGDSMVVVAALAVKALGLLGKGLRKDFSTAAKICISSVLEKLKDKNRGMLEACHATLDAFVPACVTLQDISDDLLEVLGGKVPKAKGEVYSFLVRAFAGAKPLGHKAIGPITLAAARATDDPAPEVREAAISALSAAVKVFGQAEMAKVLAKVDAKKLTRIVGNSSASSSTEQNKPARPSTSAGQASRPGAPPRRPATSSGKSSVTKPSAAAVSARPSTSKGIQPAKSGPKSGRAVSKEPSVPTCNLAADSVEPTALEALPEAPWAQLKSSQWKDRLSAVESIHDAAMVIAESLTAEQCEAVVRHTGGSLGGGWKETNFQVLAKVYSLIAALCQSCPVFPSSTPKRVATPLADKLADAKLKGPAADTLLAMCECCGPSAVVPGVCAALANQKNPRILAEGGLWLQNCLLSFGPKATPVRALIDCVKLTLLEAANPQVKAAGVKVLGSLSQFVGPSIRDSLADVKPALLATIDEEIARLADVPAPAPSRKVINRKSKPATQVSQDAAQISTAGEAVQIGASGQAELPDDEEEEDIFDRADISSEVAPLIKPMGDSAWKTRADALAGVEKIIKAANTCIQPSLGELMPALRERLKDTNKNLVASTLHLLCLVAKALGSKHADTYAKGVLKHALANAGDNKRNVRDAAVECLNSWSAVSSMEKIVPPVAGALASDNPAARKDLLEWLAANLQVGASSKSSAWEATPLFKPVVDGLLARQGEVRTAAEGVLEILARKGCLEGVRSASREFKPAQQQDIKAALARVGGDTGSAEAPSQPVPSNTGKAKVAAKPSSKSSKTLALNKDKEVNREDAGAVKAAATKPKAEPPQMIGVPGARDKRAAKERGKTRPPVFDSMSEVTNAVAELRHSFTGFASEPLISRLFSTDTKKVIDGLAAIGGQLADHKGTGTAAVLDSADLIIKWSALKLYEMSNVSLAMRVLDLLNPLLDAMQSSGMPLTEGEACILLPCLAEKVGANQDTLRNRMREMLRRLPAVVPASRLYSAMHEASQRTKNNRSRADCLDEMAYLLDTFGLEVAGPPRHLAAVAATVSERDPGVRNGALNVLSSAYSFIGERVWKHVGSQIPEVARSMIDQRFKNASKKEKEEPHQEMEAAPTAPVEAVESQSEDTFADDLVPTLNFAENAPGTTRPSTSSGRIDLLTAPTPRLPNRPATASGLPTVSAVTQSCRSVIHSSSTDSRIKSMKTFCAALTKDPSVSVSDIDELITVLTGCLGQSLGGISGSIRLVKHCVNTLIQVFQQPSLAQKVSEDSLATLLGELLFRVSGPLKLPADDDLSPEVVNGALTRLAMIVLDSANPNRLLTTLLQFLYETDPPADLRERQTPEFTEWVLRCLLKLTKGLPTLVDKLSLDQLLWDMHLFLCAHPPSKYQNRDFMPLRLLKTLLNELVKLKGEDITQHLSLVPTESNPTIVLYLKMLLQQAGHSAAGIGGGESANQTATTSDSAHQAELSNIFAKIGSRATTKEGITDLFKFKTAHPAVSIEPWLSGKSAELRSYIERHLAKCQLAATASEIPVGQEAEQAITTIPATQPSIPTVSSAASTGSTALSFQEKLRSLQSRVGISGSGSQAGSVPSAAAVAAVQGTENKQPMVNVDPAVEEASIPAVCDVPVATSTVEAPNPEVNSSAAAGTSVSVLSLQERLSRLRGQAAK